MIPMRFYCQFWRGPHPCLRLWSAQAGFALEFLRLLCRLAKGSLLLPSSSPEPILSGTWQRIADGICLLFSRSALDLSTSYRDIRFPPEAQPITAMVVFRARSAARRCLNNMNTLSLIPHLDCGPWRIFVVRIEMFQTLGSIYWRRMYFLISSIDKQTPFRLCTMRWQFAHSTTRSVSGFVSVLPAFANGTT